MSISKVNLSKKVLANFQKIKQGKKFCDGKPNCINV